VVPYLGVLLAMIPPILAGATKYDTLAPLIGIASGVAGFHIIALNVLYPKLIGARLHLNPVVVTVSLMFWGWLWGAMGLLLAIPITAAMKAIFDNVPEWRRYGRLMGD
jgi:predicted PurR-regulated permease PerM